MPKRTDIKKILIIGSGPIVIGQGCEFDYSGTQACKALKQEGYKIILVNSNPATIMTDPEMADKTYIEPITVEVLEKVIEKERPEAILSTMGGQTALNVAVTLADKGVLNKFNVEMIGANSEAIRMAEDRKLFKKAMAEIGLDCPRGETVHTLDEANRVVAKMKFPVILRPSFTLGGQGGGAAYNIKEFQKLAVKGLESSMIGEILIEESVIGWKEYELEVMRDIKDNVVIVCSIENFDPMGVHTGDSITVAPVQTLTDREYQLMRDAAIRVIRKIGVETGGSNIQFAVNPKNGRMLVIEMNPRVSRSSALASKATGFPIAKIAAKLAVGYSLDEIPNDITKKTPACFEPTIDYCVVKIPRFTFEKFSGSNQTLTTSMKSVGETMAIGRTFKEALQKGLRGLEIGVDGLKDKSSSDLELSQLKEKLVTPGAERVFYIKRALNRKMTIDKLHQLTGIDAWFLENMKEIVRLEEEFKLQRSKLKIQSQNKKTRGRKRSKLLDISPGLFLKAKQYGFSDRHLAHLLNSDEMSIRKHREKRGVKVVFKLVDTCSAEFEASTPYYYSTYESENESRISRRKKIVILGSGPNRIGQGIEFDYCCVHASFALKEEGYETIMVNSNPETVSTDYDTSDKLYFEPLTLEDVLNIVEKEKPEGVIVQFGGQTPLNLAVPLEQAGVKILGTSSESIDRAEDRERFKKLLKKLRLKQPSNGTAISFSQAKKIAGRIGYPILVRPSYVLGGRAMKIVYDHESLKGFMQSAVEASPAHPILIDKFLEDAIEVDVDVVADRKTSVICGIMEHIEEAGIHSGDSACVIPSYSLGKGVLSKIREVTHALAKELRIVGLMNMQYAIKGDIVYVLEVNPRASRTIPYVSKATGVPWAKIAAKIIAGAKLKSLGITKEVEINYIAVKEAVFPFDRFPEVDPVLSPEMKSTGEVMGIDTDFGMAFAKSQIAAGVRFPLKGKVFISVKDKDKRASIFIAKKLSDLGFKIVATYGTAGVLSKNGIEVKPVFKVGEGKPDIVDLIKGNKIDLIINTPSGKRPKADQISIRSVGLMRNIPCITTIAAAGATVTGIESLLKGEIKVKALQEYYKKDKD